MKVQCEKNQYPGINAHLHSLWQSEGGWDGFHNHHIGVIATLLTRPLARLGYQVIEQTSMQLRYFDLPDYCPDVAIMDDRPSGGVLPSQPGMTGEIVLLDLAIDSLTVDTDSTYSAIVIAPLDAPDRPVTWIELLSPTNKLWDVDTYVRKRRDLLREGINLVEIDYLHTSPPTHRRASAYSRRESGANPWRIDVFAPSTSPRVAALHGFGIDDPIPTVTIPLAEDERYAFDFSLAYHQHFEERLLGRFQVDYAAYPLKFSAYTPDDQARIANRMLAVIRAAQNGADLDAIAPIAVTDPLPLEEAQAAIAALTGATQTDS